jgi:hypothetical protein
LLLRQRDVGEVVERSHDFPEFENDVPDEDESKEPERVSGVREKVRVNRRSERLRSFAARVSLGSGFCARRMIDVLGREEADEKEGGAQGKRVVRDPHDAIVSKHGIGLSPADLVHLRVFP